MGLQTGLGMTRQAPDAAAMVNEQAKLSHKPPQASRWARGLVVFFGVAFVVAGVLHFVIPEVYAKMMPPYLPWHLGLVYVSGVFEVLGGVGLLVPATRRFSAWGLLALLVAVFPANVHMALNNIAPGDLAPNPLVLWGRLPFQFVAMWLIWWCALKGGAEQG